MRIAWLPLAVSVSSLALGCNPDGGSGQPDAGRIIHTADAGVKPDAAKKFDAAPPAARCNTVNQDCTDATKTKCTLVDDGSGMTLEPQCIAPTGMAAEGENCMRVANDSKGWGHDDCAAGNWCSGVGVVPPDKGGSRVCRKYCRSDLDCNDGQGCVRLSDLTPPDGFCLPMCAPFSDCGDKVLSCAMVTSDADKASAFLSCGLPGPSQAGDACDDPDKQCGPDLACLAVSETQHGCFSICDKDHACKEMGFTCTKLDWLPLPNDGGFCSKEDSGGGM